MTAGETAEAAAEYAAPWIERLARVGFAAKALLYGTVGILAAGLATGNGGRATGGSGAMRSVQRAPFGRLLMAFVAIGLVGYAVWRVSQALVDPERRGTSPKALALRVSFAARGLIHAALAISAFQLAVGNPPEDDGNDAERWVAPARGIVFIMVALLLSGAALQQSAVRAGGIDEALQSLATLGRWPFMAIAVGLIAYGAYELLNARYRRIRIN